MGKKYRNERHEKSFHAGNLKRCVNISFYTKATLGCGMNLAWQNGASSSWPHSSLPATAELFQRLKALPTPLLLLGGQNANVFTHAKSRCLKAWSNSTLGGCGRYTPDRPSKQPLDAMPGVQVLAYERVCLWCACVCTSCIHI